MNTRQIFRLPDDEEMHVDTDIPSSDLVFIQLRSARFGDAREVGGTNGTLDPSLHRLAVAG